MRRKFLLFSVTALIAIAAITGLLMFINNMVKERTTEYVFELDNAHRFLTEDMAIAFARKALALGGSDENAWEPQVDGRTIDPNGRTDKYIARSSLNPNLVSMMFRNNADRRVRCVSVEMQDKRVICAVTIPK